MLSIRHTPAVLVTVCLAGALALPLVTPAHAQDYAPPPAKLLVFTLEDESGAPRNLGAQATRALRKALHDSGRFTVEVFSRHSPTARRKVDEGALGSEDVLPPYTPPKLILIGHVFGKDLVMTGSVVDRKLDPETNVVSVAIVVHVHNVAENTDPATGGVLAQLKDPENYAASGSSRERKHFKGDPGLLDGEACADAAHKLVMAITGMEEEPPPPPEDVPKPRKKKSALQRYGWLIAALVLGGAIAVATTEDDRPPGAPPVRNLTWEFTAIFNIRLNWDAPNVPPRPVQRYRVDRRVDGGPWQRIDGGTVLAGQLSFVDTAANGYSGSILGYRVRADYGAGVLSVPVETEPISMP